MKKLPGTIIECGNGDHRKILNSIFATGGITLSQVCILCELEPHTVQNWIKRRYVPSSVNKKYNIDSLCRIVMINLLKDVLPIDCVCRIIDHANKPLNKDTDEFLSESELYFFFVETLELNASGSSENNDLTKNIKSVLRNYVEPISGTKKNICTSLEIMVASYLSFEYKRQALILFKSNEL